MILSTRGRYAVMAMVDLASCAGGKPTSLAAISERQEIPLAYLEQIFAKLRRNGLVKSVRGPGGGYLLLRPAAETWPPRKDYAFGMNVYFVVRYSSMPSSEPSRPMPDCLTPPNGAAALEMTPALRPLIPVSRRSIMRMPRARSCV